MTNSRHLQIFGNQKMLALGNRSASVISPDIDSSNMSTCTVEPLLADRILIRFDVNSEQFTTIQLPCVMYSRICQGYLVNVLNNLQIFVVNFANGAGVELYNLEGELWMELLSLPHLYLPLSVWSSVTYSRRYGKWIFMANWGEIFIMDLQENVLDAINFYPVFWMHGLTGSLYKETVLSPTY
ncbi:hypothetical protein L1987_06266 [Smallanthus sonchifolius]|uniref:Uncharacterized protein n=1 Tax=Smallanthus sonchifolius TaxID=185202 RepID=A0ACB9JXT9_9ASTR|nr:hypothetical protein L1987_06266 [Smallanthus sonchifolius]